MFFDYAKHICSNSAGILALYTHDSISQSSAFDVLRRLLTLHPSKSNEFFNQHYDKFFTAFNALLCSSNYVVRRHASKSMGQILFVKEHHDIMLRYISEKANLKIWMNLLRDSSESIQLEAFHVFKIFVGRGKRWLKRLFYINPSYLLWQF